MCTQYAPYLPSCTLSTHPPYSHCYQPPDRTHSTILFSNFVKRKIKWHFCLFKIATQRVALWHFHVYMYYNLNWFISSSFLLSILNEFWSVNILAMTDKKS
jgi:hypothetical protein